MKRFYLLIVICLFLVAQQAPVFSKGVSLEEKSLSSQVLIHHDMVFQADSSQKHYSHLTWLGSLLLPGVSQFMLDEPIKGWLMIGSFSGVYFARMIVMFFNGPFGYTPMITGSFGGHFILAAMIGIHIWSIIDALIVNQEKMKSSYQTLPPRLATLRLRENQVFF